MVAYLNTLGGATHRLRTVAADVILGQPQANCRFHGICRIDGSGVPAPPGCRGARLSGLLSWEAANRCVLTIPRGQLTAEEEIYHFGEGLIRLHGRQGLEHLFPGGGGDFELAAQDCRVSLSITTCRVILYVSERARSQDAGGRTEERGR